LTATVDVRGVGMLARTDPDERYRDYCWALERWANCPGFDALVLVENSGHDISGFRDIVSGSLLGPESVEFLSFDGQDFPRHLGKGYGEALNLGHVMSESQLLANEDYVLVRSNGRNVVENIQAFLAVLDGPVDVLCDLQQSLTWADGRVLAGTIPFFRDYVCRFGRDVDDSRGYNFEHALARAIHAAMADGLTWSPFPEPPVIQGFSGTSNKPIADRKLKRVARKLQHRVKLRMLRR
jgi:hypothetical protein